MKKVKLQKLWNKENNRYEILEDVEINEVEINGNLYIRSDANLTADSLQTIGGNLYIRSDASLPNLQTVGGYLDIYPDASLTADNLQTVGESLYIRSDASLPNLQTVGGNLYIRSDASLPNLQTVGGSLSIQSDASLTAIKLDRKNKTLSQQHIDDVKSAKVLYQALRVHKDIKVAVADGIGICYSYSKKMLNGQYFKNRLNPNMNIAVVNGVCAHGKNLKDCLKSIEKKVIAMQDTKTKIDNFIKEFPNKDEKYSAKKLVEWHNILTGSCFGGRKHFLQNNNIKFTTNDDEQEFLTVKAEFTIMEFIEMTKNEFGGTVIEKLISVY